MRRGAETVKRFTEYLAAGALFAVAVISPHEAVARIHNCENASLLPEDGGRLFLVARRVPSRRTKNSGWQSGAGGLIARSAWVTTARVTRENGVAQWWMASCSRDARNWTCEPWVLHQEIETSFDIGGVSRHVRISFDGESSLETAGERLASEALEIFTLSRRQLFHIVREYRVKSRGGPSCGKVTPLPTANEEIHITVGRDKARVSVWFGDFVRPDDVQIGIDFPLPDVRQAGPCWVARGAIVAIFPSYDLSRGAAVSLLPHPQTPAGRFLLPHHGQPCSDGAGIDHRANPRWACRRT